MQNAQYDARLVKTGAHVRTHVKRRSLTTSASSTTVTLALGANRMGWAAETSHEHRKVVQEVKMRALAM